MKSKDRPRYLLPQEYLGETPNHPAVQSALRRHRPSLFALLGTPCAAYLWRGLHTGEWLNTLLALAMSAGLGWMIWHALCTGYLVSNSGAFLRATRPFGYWLSIAVLVAAFTGLITLLILADFSSAKGGG